MIDEAQAKWVRWIYQHYADGWSCQKIAVELNHLGIKTGRGGTWAVSALYGCPNKGSGVLNNELYVGRYIWNRSQWVKDPDTGKRERLVRPREEWIIEQRDELCILPDDLWQAVRARMDGNRLNNGSKGKGARPKTLLGGLLKCGHCGGAIIAISAHQYGCAAHKDRGTAVCTGISVNRQKTDQRMRTVIREDVLQPSSIVEMRQQVEVLLATLAKNASGEASAAKDELASIDREIERLVNAIAAMGHSDAIAERLQAAEARRQRLVRQQRPAMPANTTFKIEDLMARYNRQLMNLDTALASSAESARTAVHEYFREITVEETTDGVFATFSADPTRLLLKAIGDSGYGCGGRI